MNPDHDFGDLDDQMVWVPIGDIHPWDKNPRDNDAGVEQVAASIKTFGFVNPIIVQLSSNRIIAGHTRFKASHHLSLKRVRVIFADFDDDKANAYAIADNKLAELSSWDDDILPGLLADLRDKDFDLSTLGFGEEELSNLIGDVDFLTIETDEVSNLDEEKQHICPHCKGVFTYDQLIKT